MMSGEAWALSTAPGGVQWRHSDVKLNLSLNGKATPPDSSVLLLEPLRRKHEPLPPAL